ncbi:MAG: DUF3368 domain-containing protein [Cyclobacteriaceae bacterium]
MVVVSDTSPLSNLITIGRLHLLQDLFGVVIIPEKVKQEVLRLSESGIDLKTFSEAEWIIVKKPANQVLVEQLLEELDAGEAEALALYQELQADQLLIDERKGRKKAESLNMHVIGLLGCLVKAKHAGLLTHVKEVLDAIIDQAGFRISEQLYQQVLISCKEDG